MSAETETSRAIGLLLDATVLSEQDLARASELEATATSLRESAPISVDQAIGHAVTHLIVDTAAGKLTTRDTVEAAIDIAQFQPSNSSNRNHPDKHKTLDNFDHLVEADTPFLIPKTISTHRTVVGVSQVGEPDVLVERARGRGGIADALMEFSVKKVAREGATEKPYLTRPELLVISMLYELEDMAVGIEGIDEFVSGLRIESHRRTCGHGHVSNKVEINFLKWHAQNLADACGFELSVPRVTSSDLEETPDYGTIGAPRFVITDPSDF